MLEIGAMMVFVGGKSPGGGWPLGGRGKSAKGNLQGYPRQPSSTPIPAPACYVVVSSALKWLVAMGYCLVPSIQKSTRSPYRSFLRLHLIGAFSLKTAWYCCPQKLDLN